MKTTFTRYLLFVAFALAFSLSARSQVMVRQVVASSGGSGTAGGVSFEYTIGEAAVTTLTNGADMLSQGFHQPEVIPLPGQGVNPLINALLFPNPAATTSKLQFDLLAPASTTVVVINSAGQVMYQEIKQYGQGRVTITLPVSRFAAGIYTVMLKANGHYFTEKLIVQ